MLVRNFLEIYASQHADIVLDTTSPRCNRVRMPKLAPPSCGAPKVALLTTTEVAQRLRVGTSQVRRWVANGQLSPAVTTPGGHYRFAETDIQAFERAS